MITCPNCRTQVGGLHSCELCYSSFCHECQPFWDDQKNWCSMCSEGEAKQRQREGAFSQKLKQWLNHKAVVVPPAVTTALPWFVRHDLDKGRCQLKRMDGATESFVADFAFHRDADHACRSANQSYEMLSVLAMVYNRVRTGDTICDYQPKDIELWKRVKELLK